EADLVAASAAALPDEIVPDDDVLTLAALADRRGVSESAVEDRSFPDHRLVGRTLVRPAVLDAVADDLAPGLGVDEAESILDDRGIDDASAALAELGYRVEWEGLTGGALRRRDE
ncbi:hypothetical protein BRD17_09510, partial [Halobacteriales archaeon SW_7_68_16]